MGSSRPGPHAHDLGPDGGEGAEAAAPLRLRYGMRIMSIGVTGHAFLRFIGRAGQRQP